MGATSTAISRPRVGAVPVFLAALATTTPAASRLAGDPHLDDLPGFWKASQGPLNDDSSLDKADPMREFAFVNVVERDMCGSANDEPRLLTNGHKFKSLLPSSQAFAFLSLSRDPLAGEALRKVLKGDDPLSKDEENALAAAIKEGSKQRTEELSWYGIRVDELGKRRSCIKTFVSEGTHRDGPEFMQDNGAGKGMVVLGMHSDGADKCGRFVLGDESGRERTMWLLPSRTVLREQRGPSGAPGAGGESRMQYFQKQSGAKMPAILDRGAQHRGQRFVRQFGCGDGERAITKPTLVYGHYNQVIGSWSVMGDDRIVMNGSFMNDRAGYGGELYATEEFPICVTGREVEARDGFFGRKAMQRWYFIEQWRNTCMKDLQAPLRNEEGYMKIKV